MIATELANTTYTVSDLTAETEYCFNVTAVNEAGESEKSNNACATTLKGEGISENTATFNIYPNPVNDKLVIATNVEVESVVVYDVYGRQQINKSTRQQDEITIDVTGLNSGIYFIKINTTEGEIVKRIVKQ